MINAGLLFASKRFDGPQAIDTPLWVCLLPQNCLRSIEKSAIIYQIKSFWRRPFNDSVHRHLRSDDVLLEDSYKLVRLLDQWIYKNYWIQYLWRDTHIVCLPMSPHKMIVPSAKNLKALTPCLTTCLIHCFFRLLDCPTYKNLSRYFPILRLYLGSTFCLSLSESWRALKHLKPKFILPTA